MSADRRSLVNERRRTRVTQARDGSAVLVDDEPIVRKLDEPDLSEGPDELIEVLIEETVRSARRR